jgi:glycosyltransferase involved in cell wall biosynthesis
MKILCILLNPEIRTGGHRRYLELAEGLARLGNDVFFIKNDKLAVDLPGVKFINLSYTHKKRFLPYSLYSLFLLAMKSKKIKERVGPCDYVVVHGETHFLPGLFLSRMLRTRYFYAVRSDTVTENLFYAKNEKKSPLKKGLFLKTAFKYHLYERAISCWADVIAFQSEFDRRNFVSRTKRDTSGTCVIKGNIGEPWFKMEYEGVNTSARLRKILYIGALGERKGVSHLIDACRILSDRKIPLTTTLVGKGTLSDRLKEKTRDLGLEECVFFLGRQPDPFVFMADHDLLVVPSLFDSYPDVVLEALHAGIPVLASRVGGIPDMLNFDDGLLFPPADPIAMADRIESLYSDSGEYEKARSRCASLRKNFHFDWPGAWEKVMTQMNERL